MSTTRSALINNLRQAGLSNAEIGRRLGLSRERIRQIINGRTTAKKSPAHDNPEALLSATEAAELLNVHVNTVRRWGNRGILAAYRIGPRGDRRLRRRDLNDFLLGKAESNPD